MIRTLHAVTDVAIVTDLFRRASDYVALETGQSPDGRQTNDFFVGAPPAIAPDTSLRAGFFLPDNQLAAIAEVAFGFPNSDDAYVGLLLIDPAHRGKRLGQQMLDHIFTAAKARQSTRVLIAVLEENTKGHRFWSKMGFVEELRSQPNRIGDETHVRIRMTRPL